MAIAYLTRKVSFAAGHRYHRPEWSEARNRRVFGACSNPHGHGHNYLLEVTVRGEVDGETGFAVDLGALDALLREAVLEPLDRQHLNHVVDAFAPGGAIPTCENVLVYLWPRIARGLPAGARLHRLRLHEDPTLYVDYFGGGKGAPEPSAGAGGAA
ncbi:MAG: 6-carboxytetrahydropterin synthase [Gemmatimonadetes bacterium]|nr:6-carboxytetrahydropterin synthase [Gemmatimonadota bacterium]